MPSLHEAWTKLDSCCWLDNHMTFMSSEINHLRVDPKSEGPPDWDIVALWHFEHQCNECDVMLMMCIGNRDSIDQQSKVWVQDFLQRKIFHYNFMFASQIDSFHHTDAKAWLNENNS
jgi:hypothetical protein